jgi:hypothetical protein
MTAVGHAGIVEEPQYCGLVSNSECDSTPSSALQSATVAAQLLRSSVGGYNKPRAVRTE